jgi:hypothetical protein
MITRLKTSQSFPGSSETVMLSASDRAEKTPTQVRKTGWRPDRLEVCALSVVAVIISYQIFVPPLIGMADSGDFGRLLHWRGLTHVSDQYREMYFLHFNSKYRIVPPAPGPDWYKSSTSLLIAPSRWIGAHFANSEIFDIRIYAAPCVAIFLFGLWLILGSTRELPRAQRLVLAGLLALIFTDIGYIAYYNSFYSEGTALSFFAVATGCYLLLVTRRPAGRMLAIGYFVSAAMVLTSKPQYIPLAPLFAAGGIYASKHIFTGLKRLLVWAMAGALCAVSIWYAGQTPPVLKFAPAYIEIFMDLLPHSPTPKQDLIEMGLDPDFAAYSGTTPYQADSPANNPEFLADFSSKTSSFTVPKFYRHHPWRLYLLCKRCVKHSFVTRIRYFGYYSASSGKPPFAQAFGLWSTIRERCFPRSLLFLSLFFASSLGAGTVLIRTSSSKLRALSGLYLMLVVSAVLQFFVSILVGGGEPDLDKHLFMFNLDFDICLVLVVMGIAHLLQTRGLTGVFPAGLRTRLRSLRRTGDDL